MIELKGKYNTAKVFTDNIDNTTISQVIELCNQPFVKDEVIRIMPDCHAGAGCVIGTTMTLTDKVVPNLVGVDIGCGMEVIRIADKNVDLKKLDSTIRSLIPSGFSVRETPHHTAGIIRYNDIKAVGINLPRAIKSMGTLGGGNHFIELDVDDYDNYYLVIHSGSRNLGKQIAEYWQNVATVSLKNDYEKDVRDLIQYYKDTKNYDLIESAKSEITKPPTEALSYLYGQNFKYYMNDMDIAQDYAKWNRKAMGMVIVEAMGFEVDDVFTTIHNYIDTDQMILRKGAVSARRGERLIIPINMRDGSIIATGSGNVNWNYSAPHGAGRLMARGEAKRTLTMDDYHKSMDGIFTTSVNLSTLDEAPMAYKDMNEIISNIGETVAIDKIIKPVYNYKDSGD